MRSQRQKQAWIENWTIWALSGMIGMIQHIIDQARYHRIPARLRLKTLSIEMKIIISDIKKDQADRKAKRK